jgi:hypothetical protein
VAASAGARGSSERLLAGSAHGLRSKVSVCQAIYCLTSPSRVVGRPDLELQNDHCEDDTSRMYVTSTARESLSLHGHASYHVSLNVVDVQSQ